MADNLGFRRMLRANRLIAEGKCPGCEMDYAPRIAKLETELRDESAWLESHWKQAMAEGKDNYAVHLQNAIEALKSYGGKG